MKHPIVPERIRKVPPQFSWIDHRLVRDRHIESITHRAATLYLFLVTVADAQGLSYYSDASLVSRLSMDAPSIKEARRNLISAGLIAYKKPIYQVLPLDPMIRAPLDEPLPIGRIFKQMMEERS